MRAVRQGEWFFDPVTHAERARIAAAQRRGAMAIDRSLERDSSHRASVLLVADQSFAIGKVTDTRVKHHRPLVLNDWHRVTRNAELAQPAAERGAPARCGTDSSARLTCHQTRSSFRSSLPRTTDPVTFAGSLLTGDRERHRAAR